MDVEERAHNESLLQIYTGHLRQLEIMAAKYGDLAVPSHVTLEIEEYRRKIADLEAHLRSPTTGRSAELRHNLPPRDYEHFVGRQKELAEIRRLLGSRSRAFVVTIDGIGGIGKSALALEIAYSFLDRYADLLEVERFMAIVWVSAKRTYLTAIGIRERRQVFRTLDDLYAAIARVLEYPAITRVRPEEQHAIVEQVLRQQRTLLILDNLETVDDEDLMDFLHELPEPTKALVTTRHRIDVAHPVRLTGMSHEDSLGLIAQEMVRKNVSLSHEQREELWQRTGGVPLAIVWSIGLMGIGGSVESVLHRLGSGQSDIARFCFEQSSLQIRRRDAHKLLLALSLFATDASREALGLVAGFVKFDDTGEVIETDEFGRDVGLEELLRLSLINKEGERFSLLPLTKMYIQGEASNNAEWIDAARQRLYNYFSRLSGGWSDDWHRHDQVERELSNILAIVDELVASLPYQQMAEESPIIDPSFVPQARRVVTFLSKITRTCRHRGYWRECERLCRLQINIAKAINSADYAAWPSYFLGRISYYRGDMDLAHQCAIEARKYWERAEREKSTCYADRLLGLLALSDRRLDEAAALLNTAIDSYRRSRTEEQLSSLQNFEESLGDLARAMNDLPLAAQWYQRAVNNAQKWNDLPYQAFSLIKLGEVMLMSADLPSAQKCFLEGLSAARECGRVDAIAYALYDIAIIQDRQGQRQSAQSNADQALDLFRRLGMKREQTEAEALLARLAEGSQSS